MTRKGIWAAGCLGLAAVTAFCLMHHAPSTTQAANAKIDPVKLLVQAPEAAKPIATPEAQVAPVLPKSAALTSSAITGPVAAAISPTISLAKPSALAAQSAVKLPKASPSSKKAVVSKKKRSNKSFAAQRKLQQIKAKAKARKLLALKRSAKRTALASCESQQSAKAIKSICFTFNSDKLSAASKVRLDKIVPILNQNNTARYELAGFTDRNGSASYNDGLASRRAGAVQSYLAEKGVSPAQLSAKSYGAEQGSNFNQHRRVDVKVVQP